MKQLRLPVLMTAFMFTVGTVVSYAQDAVKPTVEEKATVVVKKKTPVSYHYKINSNNLADMKAIGNWEIAVPACDEEGNRPCVILFEGDIEDFEAYLQTFSSAAAVTARADEKKTVL